MNQFWRTNMSVLTITGLTTVSVLGQTAPPNRQQALYDQYNGINHKAVTARQPTKLAKPVAQRPRSESTPVAPVSAIPSEDAAQPVVQLTARTRIRIGARGGILTPVLIGNNRYSAGTDFIGGVMLVVGSGRVQFQPEVNYSRTALRNRFLGTGVTRSAIDQVVVPLLARLSFGSVTGNQVYINAGPYSAYETSTSVNGLKIPFDRDEQRISYGAVVGLGLAIRTGPGHIGLDVRGRYQLTNRNPVGSEGRSDAVYTEATLSYLYPLGRH
jgi:hypothetical protein